MSAIPAMGILVLNAPAIPADLFSASVHDSGLARGESSAGAVKRRSSIFPTDSSDSPSIDFKNPNNPPRVTPSEPCPSYFLTAKTDKGRVPSFQ